MPWRVETPMSQRQDFVEAWARGHWHPTELCARFGISRKTGYKWWHRYDGGGLAAREKPWRTTPVLTRRQIGADPAPAESPGCGIAPACSARATALHSGSG